MREFTQNRQIGTALPLAVTNRIQRNQADIGRQVSSTTTTDRGGCLQVAPLPL
jgi:hypothetical protein